jgi:hypothetical protein
MYKERPALVPPKAKHPILLIEEYQQPSVFVKKKIGKYKYILRAVPAREGAP